MRSWCDFSPLRASMKIIWSYSNQYRTCHKIKHGQVKPRPVTFHSVSFPLMVARKRWVSQGIETPQVKGQVRWNYGDP